MHKQLPSVSVIIPCKNERGTIERIVQECPIMGSSTELIFVIGDSQDGSLEEAYRVQQLYKNKTITVIKQDKPSKARAVYLGFEHATGDILMILDGDVTVCSSELPNFYQAATKVPNALINGTRLVYPMEKGAMPLLNYLVNKCFALLFSLVLRQRITDTLCGTKVLHKSAYKKIIQSKKFFTGADPFGDFYLLFGAAYLKLTIADMPVRYKRRTYGVSQIHRFYHGSLLLKLFLRGVYHTYFKRS